MCSIESNCRSTVPAEYLDPLRSRQSLLKQGLEMDSRPVGTTGRRTMRRRAVSHVRVERRRVRRATESPKGPTTEISVSLDTTATLWAIDKPGSCISHSKVRRACQKSLEGGLTGGASGTKACCRKPAQKNDPTSSKRGYVGLHSEVPDEKRRG